MRQQQVRTDGRRLNHGSSYDLQGPPGGHHQVFRLQVPVHDLLSVHVVKTFNNRGRVESGGDGGARPGFPVVGATGRQRGSDELIWCSERVVTTRCCMHGIETQKWEWACTHAPLFACSTAVARRGGWGKGRRRVLA